MPQSVLPDVIGNSNTKLGELLYVRIYFLISVKLCVIVCAKVFKMSATEDKVNRNQYRVSHRHSSPVLSAVGNQPVVLCIKKTIFLFFAA